MVSATAKYVRIAPRKARQVVELIRGKSVKDARAILILTPRGAAPVVGKVLASAVANAENNDDLVADELYVAKAYVDEGPLLARSAHRFLPLPLLRPRTMYWSDFLPFLRVR